MGKLPALFSKTTRLIKGILSYTAIVVGGLFILSALVLHLSDTGDDSYFFVVKVIGVVAGVALLVKGIKIKKTLKYSNMARSATMGIDEDDLLDMEYENKSGYISHVQFFAKPVSIERTSDGDILVDLTNEEPEDLDEYPPKSYRVSRIKQLECGGVALDPREYFEEILEGGETLDRQK